MLTDADLDALEARAAASVACPVQATSPHDIDRYHLVRTDIPRLLAEVRRLREVERIAVETLNLIARCGCKACGPALPDTRATRSLADDALTRMDTVE